MHKDVINPNFDSRKRFKVFKDMTMSKKNYSRNHTLKLFKYMKSLDLLL